MGIIQKQALRSTFINFIGIGFGSISRFLMPFVLEAYQIGIVSIIDAIAGSFSLIFNMGYHLVLKKMFPNYRNEDDGHAGFLALGIFLTLFGFLTGFGIYYFFEDFILSNNSEDINLIKPFAFLIPILIFFKILFVNIDGYVKMLFKTVIGTFLDGFVTKIIVFTGILLFIYSIIDYEYFVYIYTASLSIPGLVILIYAIYKTKKITLPSPTLFKDSKKLNSYILFGILSGASSSIIQFVDTIMVYKLTPSESEAQVGIYSVMFFAAILIQVPAKNLIRISSVVLAESWKKNETKDIQNIYEKSCVNLLIIGGFLFLVGWACLDSVLHFLPKYQDGKYVFFFLGLAKVIELGTGINTEVIETSEKYKYNTYFNLILTVIVIIANYFLIIEYGIIGAAIATFIGMTFVNILRANFLRRVFKLKAFNLPFYKTAFIFILFLFILSFEFTVFKNPIFNAIFYFISITVTYWFLIIKFNLSPEINQWLKKIVGIFLKK